ncbi:MAG: hypothetical protein LC768_00645 [Acidobacteria bacterium]|nr:hypothetical protein [Acidobacteriota bacterium]
MDDQTLHHFMEDLSPIVIGVVLTLATAWVLTVVVKAFKEKSILRTRAELYSRLLDKFGSGNEFAEYLESETGRQFVEEITVQGAAPTSKILGSIQKGVIMTLIGLGMIVLANVFFGGDLFNVVATGGTIALMLGVGFLISTFISYHLSKSWGLIGAKVKPKDADQTVKKQTSEL